MRKLKIVEHMSLDGVIQSTEENNFPYANWTASYRTPEGLGKVLALYGEKFDLLLGRTTYDQWSAFWPKSPANPMGDRLNAATKYVVTHRPESLEWGPSKSFGSNFIDEVRNIKNGDGPDIIVAGSSTLISKLLENGLADEVIVFVYPTFIGKGKRFFTEGTAAVSLEFLSTHTMPTGIQMNTYKYLGPLKSS